MINKSFPACANATRAKNSMELIRGEFSSVFRDELSKEPMDVGLMKIHLEECHIPYKVMTPRLVPLHFQQAADDTVASLIKAGVIVREDGPTDWCSPAFFVPKCDGKRVRLVTDYTKLNKYVKRPVHPLPSVQEIVQCIPPRMQFFAKLEPFTGTFSSLWTKNHPN